jgi:hypothetical protein
MRQIQEVDSLFRRAGGNAAEVTTGICVDLLVQKVKFNRFSKGD